MRIIFVIPFAALVGGHRVIAQYARRFEARGHEVWVTSRPDEVTPVWKQWFYRAIGRTRKIRPKRQQTTMFDFLGSRHVILDRVREVEDADIPDADAVFATWWSTAPSVARLSPQKGTKFYLLQDYEMFDYLPQDQVAATFHLPLHKIAVSSYIAQQVCKNHGNHHIDVVANSVDRQQFDAPERHKNSNLTLGFVYDPAPRKQVSLAIEVATRARALIPDLKVISFGAGEISQDLPLPDWITYQRDPPQADIPGLYAQCDVWLFTSLHEGFGLPLLEAMACRTPVLATRAGAAPDLVTGENGVLLDGDPEMFVQQLKRFAQMPDAQWRAFSAAAHATGHGYSWNDASERMLETMKKAISTPP